MQLDEQLGRGRRAWRRWPHSDHLARSTPSRACECTLQAKPRQRVPVSAGRPSPLGAGGHCAGQRVKWLPRVRPMLTSGPTSEPAPWTARRQARSTPGCRNQISPAHLEDADSQAQHRLRARDSAWGVDDPVGRSLTMAPGGPSGPPVMDEGAGPDSPVTRERAHAASLAGAPANGQ